MSKAVHKESQQKYVMFDVDDEESVYLRVRCNPSIYCWSMMNRFVIGPFEDGSEAFLEYERDNSNNYVITHTVVPPSQRGKGLAEVLAQAAFEYVKSVGNAKVIPVCSYISDKYVPKHPEYDSIVLH